MELNESLNASTQLFAEHYSLLGGTATIVVVIFIILVIITGNFLTILAVAKERRLQQLQNWFIVSLAVSDLLVGLLIMPLSLTYELLDLWVLPEILCELWLALDVLFVTASILNLCVISLDRYWSVVDPISYMHKRTKKRVGVMIAAAWIVALLISFPPLVGWKEPLKDQLCAVSERLDYVLYSSCGSFFIPSILLMIVYVRIYQVTHRRAKHLLGKSSVGVAKDLTVPPVTERKTSNCELLTTADKQKIIEMKLVQRTKLSANIEAVKNGKILPQTLMITENREISGDLSEEKSGLLEESEETKCTLAPAAPNGVVTSVSTTGLENVSKKVISRKQMIKKREARATAILGFILFGFIGCWLPFFTLYVWGAIPQFKQKYPVSEEVFDVFFWLGYCNSAFNPIIYALINSEFRKAFKKLLYPKKSLRTYRL